MLAVERVTIIMFPVRQKTTNFDEELEEINYQKMIAIFIQLLQILLLF